jgi:Protein of unknown function (DUF3037)
MHAHDVYDYAIVRVVPRVEREEFINAGVILSCQRSGYLQAAMALDEARLLALDPQVDLPSTATWAASLRSALACPRPGPSASCRTARASTGSRPSAAA